MSDHALAKSIGGHHRGHRGRTDDWLTPPSIIDALGPFDLDPCACKGMPWQTAETMLTPADNGWGCGWSGRVWLNPPYGPVAGQWLRRLAEHGNGIALVFARTETAMFHDWVWPFADALLFLRGRLNFHYPSGERASKNSGGPSVLIAYGDANAEALRNCGIAGALVGRAVNIEGRRTHTPPRSGQRQGAALF